MDKISNDTSADESLIKTTTPPETRTLREVVQSSRRIGGNYGSLAKSQVQPTFYISHKLESDDTLQRLALKYSVHIQDIKRVNKLWSDAELGLLEHVYIPVNSMQLSTLRTIYPTLNIVQNLADHLRKSSIDAISSDTSTSISTVTTTNNSSYQDYLSKIDQQIKLTKKSLQSLDTKEQHPNLQSTSNISPIENNHTTIWNNGRQKGVHHTSDSSVFVKIPTQNSREKHVSSALKRIQQEQDNFDEL